MPTAPSPASEIAESIALINAATFGEQPAILANLSLAQQIFNANLQQQVAVAQQQAMNLVRLAVTAKCAALILDTPSGSLQAMKEAVGLLHELQPPDHAAVAAKPAAASPESAAAPAAQETPADGFAETATTVAIAGLKSIGEQPAMLANLAYANTVATTNLSQQNAVANQQAMNELGISVVAKAVNMLATIEPKTTGDASLDRSLADQIAELRAVIQAFTAKSV